MANFTESSDSYITDNFEFDNLLAFGEISSLDAQLENIFEAPSSYEASSDPNSTLFMNTQCLYDIDS